MGGPRSIGYPGADMTDALQGAVHRSLESGEALDIQGTGCVPVLAQLRAPLQLVPSLQKR